MFSLPLFKQSVRSNCVLWGAMTAVMSVLCVQFSALDMTQALLFTIFYGMMTTILPGIYVMISANKLLASQVDRGSMAYVLSTPIKRSTVVITQGVFMLVSLLLMFTVNTVAHLIVNQITPLDMSKLQYTQFSGELTFDMIIKINLSAYFVCLAMAAVCFLFSGIFNSTKLSIGFSGTFVGVTILANMLAMFGSLGVDGLDKFKYLTICSFYDYGSVLSANSEWIGKMIVPMIIAVAAFISGGIVFKKKDLPL